MSTVSSVTSGLWQQIQSQQAQRAADQAAQVARMLQSQASEARTEAERARDNARSLEIKASQAQTQAVQASMDVLAAKSFGNMQAQQANVYSKLPEMVTRNSTTTVQATALVAPASTETVGTVINTTA
jgi:hypothetical protein